MRALRAWNYLFCRTYHRLTVLAPPQLPPRGPTIVVCNHVGSLDPLLIQSACARRVIVWMMAKEYYETTNNLEKKAAVLGKIAKNLERLIEMKR